MLRAKHVPHKRDLQTVLLNSSPGLQNPHKHIWRTYACCNKKKTMDLPRSEWKTWAHKADVQRNTEMQTIDPNSNRAFDYIPTKSKPQASGIGNEQEWEISRISACQVKVTELITRWAGKTAMADLWFTHGPLRCVKMLVSAFDLSGRDWNNQVWHDRIFQNSYIN